MSANATTRVGQGGAGSARAALASLRTHAIAIGAFVGYALFRLAVNSERLSESATLTFDWLIFVVANLTMTFWSVRAFIATRKDSGTGRAWLLIAIASAASSVAAIVETSIQIDFAQYRLPSWVHILFSVVYALYAIGLLSFPMAPRRRADRITLFFDIATVALSGVMIFWFWSVRTGVFDMATSLEDKAVVIGYPTADLAILLIASILLVRAADSRSRTIFGYIALSYLSSSIADFWYGYLQLAPTYRRNTVVDLCWFAAVVFPILAARSQLAHSASRDAPKREAARWMSEIPLIAVGLAFVMLFLAIRNDRARVEIQLGAGALLMTFLAIARQRISARDAARLMAERATRDARFRALVQNSTDVVTVLDASLHATYVSPAIEGVLGLTPENRLERAFVEIVSPDDREGATELLARVVARPFATELLRCRMVHADGSLRTMETLASNLLDDPAVEGVVLNSRDISQRAALEEQLQHTQKLEVVGRLAGGVAHDFNNLLMVIGANAEFVLSDDSDPGAKRDAAVEIQSATKRAAALTKQLLAFSRREESRPVVVDPNDVVRHVERMLARLLQHATRLQTDLTDIPLAICIDPGQLEQALLNLAVNARDAMPSAGELRLRTRGEHFTERTQMERGWLLPGNYVAITVEDNGAGMTPEVRSRIFEPFFTTKPIGSGTGLGLAMVLSVVQQAGGQVQVRSAPGEGTTITLYLPAAKCVAGMDTPRAFPALLRGTGRLLVVDDEEGVRTVLQRLLRRIGYEVDAVGDAGTALAMLSVQPLRFDLVLSDILMPDKTGLELAQEILGAKLPVAIVLMTGFADHGTVREATETHRLPVLRKPFEVDQLAVVVEEALARTLAMRTAS